MLKGIDGALTEMQSEDLTTIYNSGQHLLTLIDDILDQAKIESGKMELHLAFFDVNAVLKSVKAIGIGLVKEKPVDIYVEVEPNLAPAYGDESRTRQILLNLVSNASKFTYEGHIIIRAYPIVDEASGRGFIQIDVIDTGIGIEKDHIPILFERFRQVESSLTRSAGGTGLGLPLSMAFAKLQGGSLTVTSSVVDEGSTFSLTVPACSDEEVIEPEQ
jgi:signal transduction histidine kinase